MASALIQLTTAGADTDSFSLLSNVTGYGPAFESGISRASLLAGYTSNLVPAGTTTIRVKSNSVGCSNFVDIVVGGLTTTSTTTTTTSLPFNSVLYNDTINDITLRFNLYGKVGAAPYQLIYAEPNVITILTGDYYEFYQAAYPGAFSSTSNVYFKIEVLAGSIGIQAKSFPTAPSDTIFYLDKWTGSALGTTTPRYFTFDSPALTIANDSNSGTSPNAVFGISAHLSDAF
jgi:hypothetical protein